MVCSILVSSSGLWVSFWMIGKVLELVYVWGEKAQDVTSNYVARAFDYVHTIDHFSISISICTLHQFQFVLAISVTCRAPWICVADPAGGNPSGGGGQTGEGVPGRRGPCGRGGVVGGDPVKGEPRRGTSAKGSPEEESVQQLREREGRESKISYSL